MSELRLIRALDRIDNLKAQGKWSFRQPKKHRGVGSLTKTHLDYLMDEMVSLKFIYTMIQFIYTMIQFLYISEMDADRLSRRT
jgi:hypothetical protein